MVYSADWQNTRMIQCLRKDPYKRVARGIVFEETQKNNPKRQPYPIFLDLQFNYHQWYLFLSNTFVVKHAIDLTSFNKKWEYKI